MRELILHCPGQAAEALSDALLAAGCLSVSVEDLDSGSAAEQALFGEPGATPATQAWARNRITALLADGTDPAQLLAVLAGQNDAGATAWAHEWLDNWQLQTVPDADWVRVTQAQFGPIAVAGVRRRIDIIPSWHMMDEQRREASRERLAIQLDPGLAFGTGSHPTTHLCLQWLLDHLPAGARVLDYGCGSGILAIAAAKLGAGDVLAVDIDPQALAATEENARVNAVRLTACLPDQLPTLAEPGALGGGSNTGSFEVLVANILSSPLKVLAPMLAGRVAAGGSLVLSGVLARQADEVAQAYAPWLALSVWRELDGWVCLSGQRAGTHSCTSARVR